MNETVSDRSVAKPSAFPACTADELAGATSLDLLLWRSALPRAPAVPDVSDQLFIAAICQEAGLDSLASMLYRTTLLRRGFSPRLRRQKMETAELADLYRTSAFGSCNPAVRGTIDIAIAELEAFARTHAAAAVCEPASERPRSDCDGKALDTPLDDLPALVGDLCAFLVTDAIESGSEEGESLLARCCRLNRSAARFDYRSFAGAPLPLLATAMALSSLREFFMLTQDFMIGIPGSAALLHAVARFDEAGLGPYFGNLPRLARNSRDVFELSRVARSASAEAGFVTTIEQWVVLLSTQLTGALRDEIMDDLADLRALSALEVLYDRMARRSDDRIEVPLVKRLRDAALDNGDYGLASRAQNLLVRLFPAELLERRILGEIQATGGWIRAAEQTFLACLVTSPEDAAIIERLVAIRSRDFSTYRIGHGFGTPPDRLRTRLHRRGDASYVQPGPRARVLAVDL